MSVALPEAIAQQQRMLAVARAQIKGLHIETAKGIYERIISSKYLMESAAAAHKVRTEADPFGVRDSSEVEEELPDKVGFVIDVDAAAQISVHAANAFLLHMRMIDQDGNPVIEGMGKPEEPKKIVTEE